MGKQVQKTKRFRAFQPHRSGYPSQEEIQRNLKILENAGLIVPVPTKDGSLRFYLPLAHRAAMEQSAQESSS